jgi:hypothetical protein
MWIGLGLALWACGDAMSRLLHRRPRESTAAVIYLGCDCNDDVGSMRAALLRRMQRGELTNP